jgi:hypothetical protein
MTRTSLGQKTLERISALILGLNKKAGYLGKYNVEDAEAYLAASDGSDFAVAAALRGAG